MSEDGATEAHCLGALKIQAEINFYHSKVFEKPNCRAPLRLPR